MLARSAFLFSFMGLLLTPAAVGQVPPPRPSFGPSMVVTGPMEVVFDWSEDRCTDRQIPDLPARARRTTDGGVQLILSHDVGYLMTGPDLQQLRVDCTPAWRSAYGSDPASFSNHEWVAAPYAAADGTVYALMHNEFHGQEQLGDECPSGQLLNCWYNSITLFKSEDDGRTYAPAMPPPAHLVAAPSTIYRPDGGTFGAFEPSNIVEWQGLVYAVLKIQTFVVESQHVCLMRTDDISDPRAWRFWTGRAFEGVFADPYEPDARTGTCPALAVDEIAQMHESLSWNNHLGKFVLVGTSSDPTLSPNRFGFYYALSDDLIHWDRRRLLVELTLPWSARSNTDVMYLYPSLIDPDSASPNFDVSGETAWLYFTRHNRGQGSLDRDLVRLPVRFFDANE